MPLILSSVFLQLRADSFGRSTLLSLFYSWKMLGGLFRELCGSPSVASEPLTLNDEISAKYKIFLKNRVMW